ncbi:hypothetical protein PWG14_04670 (plasmid) [Chromobacterium amazonense]|uniref:hypothetical protein n=1 Tax=Chromobacterium amazonense TaxID=1382803 RepID=UPI00237EE35C|nr:hypothetical protein [Chromobacterium amazonense]MDE1712055.1 hypothetical protein [Chromobacterium amazonense]
MQKLLKGLSLHPRRQPVLETGSAGHPLARMCVVLIKIPANMARTQDSSTEKPSASSFPSLFPLRTAAAQLAACHPCDKPGWQHAQKEENRRAAHNAGLANGQHQYHIQPSHQNYQRHN